ncbi:hypothetical protein BUALT_Bualt19G0115100 [Buddleja alternifolia]|uniref:F-box domain-containing protein n=1 Tax=Buddleja alternifolia TaxID=168488 RepID=A0AAV6WAF8_9LAMI|nr:hypothetical protein BUALT_Bualt19G0115100 [Buddleja alternifolia]
MQENMISDWADLPKELLDLILSNLYAEDRLTFGLVCRSWNSVATTSTYCHSPYLMFYHRREHRWKFFQYNGSSDKDFPQLYNAEIRCSKYGWLLVSRDDGSLFFFDPFKEQGFENSQSTTFLTLQFVSSMSQLPQTG